MRARISRITGEFSVVALVLGLTFSAHVYAGGKPAPTVSFGITAPMTKIGDACCNPTYGGGYHNIAVHGNEIYVAYTNSTSCDGEVVVGYSLNGGLKWERSMVVAHGDYIDATGAAIAVGPDPLNPNNIIIHVAWGDYDTTIPKHGIFYSRGVVDDYGTRRWSTPIDVSGSVDAFGYMRTIAADSVGGVHIAFGGFTVIYPRNDSVYYSHSSDAGATFSEIATVIGVGGGEPSIAADTAGNVYMSWNDSQNVFLSKKPSGSSGWNPPVPVNGNVPYDYTSIAVYDTNHIYIAIRDHVFWTSNGGNIPGDWHQTLVSQDPGTGSASIAVDQNGILSMAIEAGGGATYFSTSTNGGSTWTTPVKVLDGASFPNLAVSATGQVYLFVDGWSPEGHAVYFSMKK